MVVISGIQTAIKIARVAIPIAIKAGKFGYRTTKATHKGAKWLRRHPKVAKYGTAAAGVGSLLLDLTNIDYDALLPKTIPGTTKTGQTRDYMVIPGSRPRNRYGYCPPSNRRSFSRQKRSY